MLNFFIADAKHAIGAGNEQGAVVARGQVADPVKLRRDRIAVNKGSHFLRTGPVQARAESDNNSVGIFAGGGWPIAIREPGNAEVVREDLNLAAAIQHVDKSIARFIDAFYVRIKISWRSQVSDGLVLVIVNSGRCGAPNAAVGGRANAMHGLVERTFLNGSDREFQFADLRKAVPGDDPDASFPIFTKRTHIIFRQPVGFPEEAGFAVVITDYTVARCAHPHRSMT